MEFQSRVPIQMFGLRPAQSIQVAGDVPRKFHWGKWRFVMACVVNSSTGLEDKPPREVSSIKLEVPNRASRCYLSAKNAHGRDESFFRFQGSGFKGFI